MIEYAILFSEFLTVVVIGLSLAVVILWVPGNQHRETTVKQHASVRWLVTGIVLSFAASIGDNLWWGIAWGLRVENRPEWSWWFTNGVYSNIIFRQGLKCVAAWCHVRAAVNAGIISIEAARDWLWVCLVFAALVTGALLAG